MDIEFTREEISVIEKNLGFIVFDWAKHLINHIISQARNKGIKTVYMNTMETLNAGALNDVKMEYFYKKLPPLLGFKKEEVKLRNNIIEIMWAYHLDKGIQASIRVRNLLFKIAKQFTLEEIPSTYQGAFIGIIGKKPFYNEMEVRKVLNILEKRKGAAPKSPKSMAKFYYDWESKTWSGGQRFKEEITENVVLQKIPSEMQNFIQSTPALLKFWSFVLSQTQHFDPDTIGFALISKVSSEAWVINEIQTDVINAYMKLRRLDRKESISDNNKSINIDTLKDMLQAQNKSKWISKVEMNKAFANQLMNNPGMIQSLPDDSADIDAWIAESLTGMEGQEAPQNLMQYFNSVNFNTRIFKI